MTKERAIEILDPMHCEHYDSIETVNEACRIGMDAIKRLVPTEPIESEEPFEDDWDLMTIVIDTCPTCHGRLWHMDKFCPCCGQALDWKRRMQRFEPYSEEEMKWYSNYNTSSAK